MIAEKSNETWEWTIEMGATWAKNDNDEYFLYPYGGHTVMRSIAQGDGGGANVTGPFAEKLKGLGCRSRDEAHAHRAGEGRERPGAIGAIVHDKPSGNDVESGTPVAIKANKAVVLTTGGFGRDLAFRQAQDPRLDDSVDCTNQEGATAESLRASVAAGAGGGTTD